MWPFTELLWTLIIAKYCLSIHLSHDSKTTRPNFAKFSVRVAGGRGLILFLTSLRYVMFFRFCG